jgi:hypothetical protein
MPSLSLNYARSPGISASRAQPVAGFLHTWQMTSEWACAFCGRSDVPRTKEHVLRKDFQGKIPSMERATFTRDFPAEPDRGVKRWDVPKSNFDMTINEVCAPCNHGWMNDLESRVEETVIALAHGRRPSIAVDHLHDLRFWMVKTALVKSLMQRDQSHIHADLCREMFEHQAAPPVTSAQFSICTEQAPHAYGRLVWIKFVLPEKEAVLTMVCFGVGRLSFQVMLTNHEEMAGLGRDLLRSARVVKGWNAMPLDRRRALKPSPHELTPYRLYQQSSILRDVTGHGLDADDPNPTDWGFYDEEDD